MAEWLARRPPNHKIVGSSPAKTSWLIKKPSRVGYGWRQWCLGSLSRKWVPGYRQRWQLYLDYPWRLEACKRVYTPQGVEQVMDVTGLPGIIICKALWASLGKGKALYKNCILLLLKVCWHKFLSIVVGIATIWEDWKGRVGVYKTSREPGTP